MQYKTTEAQRVAARRWQAAHPWRYAWHAARARARKTGRAFSITEADLSAAWPKDGRCPALGIVLAPLGASRGTTRQGPRADSATLDRIDNNKGYVPGNVIFISWRANRIKETATAKDLLAVGRWLSLREIL